jgi:hypothetical protein
MLFAWTSLRDARDDSVIRVTPADTARLRDQWASQLGREPTADELAALVHEHVQEEVLVREAQRLGLAEGDVVIRRRLVQKLRFVTEDLAVSSVASEEELEAFYQAESERYRESGRVSFSHVFLSRERRSDARGDAVQLLGDVKLEESWRGLGDPFILRRSYEEVARRELLRDFGEAFSTALDALEPGRWQGPVDSELGVHLVRVEGRRPSNLPSFAAVRGRVEADFNAERRSAANQARIDELVGQYRVEIEP